MLKVEGLTVHGLAPVSFALERGDCLVVRGPSGSGKSLLLRAIADLDPAAGSLSFDGKARNALRPEEWRRQVRYLSTESGWWHDVVHSHFTDLASARALAEELGLHADLFQQPVAQLSSGERQRLAFVRGVEDQPDVLLLDEPTSALDEETSLRLEQQLVKMQKQKKILVMVTHNSAQAARFSTHRLALQDGHAEFTAL